MERSVVRRSAASEALKARLAETEAALDAAASAGRARAEFIAVMAHEMREPLNGVLGMARLLADTPLDVEQRGYLGVVVESSETLLGLISDVVDLGRIDYGRLDLLETALDIRAFLERYVAGLLPRARQKGLTVALDIAPDLPTTVRTDPGRLRQSLTNLAGNALKFTEDGGITVRASALRGLDGRRGVRIEVEDTGPGVPPAEQPLLFEPFSQAGPGRKRAYGGSGLGLVIARRMAEALGGDLILVPSASGACFRLDLPECEEAPSTAGPICATLNGATLLIVDHQPRNRERLRSIAVDAGLIVRCARSLAQASTLLDEAASRGTPFDFIVIDSMVPDGPIERLVELVRASPRTAHARLVLLAAAGVRGDAARAHGLGFAAYLPAHPAEEAFLECLRELRASHENPVPLVTVHSIEERRSALTVLVADDNPINCRLLSLLLERRGHRVQMAHNGREAVDAVQTRPFDLVLMDVQMPGLDGLAATAEIRALADPRTAAVPVWAVTADAMLGDETRCLEAGMSGYLSKPIDSAALDVAIRHAETLRRAAPLNP